MEIEVQAMPSTQRREPWNKGKAHRPETTAAAKTCLVDPYPIADEGRTRDWRCSIWQSTLTTVRLYVRAGPRRASRVSISCGSR